MLDYKQLDWKLIGAALSLSLIGILMIMSSQHFADTQFEQTYYERQSMWLLLALVGFFITIHLPTRLLDFGAYLFYGVAVIMLILVLFVGSAKMGAARWFSFGPINLAPSDVAKLAILLALSRFLAYTKLPVTSKRRLIVSGALVVIPVLLILKQPDLGTSLVFWVVLFSLWFWSGLSPWYLAFILSPVLSLITASHWLAWAVYFAVLLALLFTIRPGILFGIATVTANLACGAITPFIWNKLAEYQKLRILTFLDPGRDPRGAGYQIIQSKIAIGSGGIWGKGLMEGSQARLDFLPERHTDFIFSVLGEEFGLWGSLLVVGLFTYIFVRGVQIATRSRNRFLSNVAAGATAILMFQFFINVGMTLGFMPVTGLALPFVSYGGTSLVLTWVLVGLLVMTDYYWQEY